MVKNYQNFAKNIWSMEKSEKFGHFWAKN